MKKTPILHFSSQVLVAAVACAVTYPVASIAGGGGGSSSIVELEIIKRQKRIADALNLEVEGDKLSAEQDHGGAQGKYNTALNTLPMGTANAADRSRIVAKFSREALLYADELGKRGAFDQAQALLDTVLSENFDPENKAAKALKKKLADPDVYNPAMSEKHYANTEEVRRLFRQGLGFYDLGDWRQAEVQFNRILAIDPTNVAARRQLEASQRQVSNYLRAARDETRLRMLNNVDSLWVTPVPSTVGGPTVAIGAPAPESSSAGITYKLNNIIIGTINFDETPLADAVAFLSKRSSDDDTQTADPANKGVNFLIRNADSAKPISVKMKNQPLIEVVKIVAEQAGVRYDIQANSVTFFSGGAEGGGSTVTRQYSVPPDWQDRAGVSGGAAPEAGAAEDPFGGAAAGDTKPKLRAKPSAKQALEAIGVQFGEKDTANFSNGILTVRTSFENQDIIELQVDKWKTSITKQVYITTKFVEVSQRNTDELGFDWLMGAFNLGSSGVFGSGGTNGNASALNPADYSVVSPGGGAVGGSPITRGLRFGTDAIARNAIDSIIQGGVSGASSVSPATFALAGVFTDPQFQVMMRALSQKKGVDLMTAPSIMVRSGQRSKIEVIREFPYPTEFDPPQIPQSFGGGSSLSSTGLGSSSTGGSFPVTPTTPSSFTFKNTGVTMEVEAVVADDNFSIDLQIAPEVIEFDGFINYGSPIQTTGINALGQSEPVVLTENKILQPVFATRKLSTQVMIYDRQTVGIGGLIREDVQSVEDKVPLFSSLPIVGRLFKTKAEEHYKRNLMIYVTGALKDPTGQDVHGDNAKDAAPVGPEPAGNILLGPNTP